MSPLTGVVGALPCGRRRPAPAEEDDCVVTKPVKVGEAVGAYPAIDAPEGIVTVPVKVGEAMGEYVEAAVAGLRPAVLCVVASLKVMPTDGMRTWSCLKAATVAEPAS